MFNNRPIRRTANFISLNPRLILTVGLVFAFLVLVSAFGPAPTVAGSARSLDAPPPRPEATTVIFNNTTPISIVDNTTANPYPSVISVSGVNPAYVTNVRVSFTGFFHTFPDDIDMMLVGPQGQRTMLMSDAGGGNPGLNNATVVFDQTAATPVPDGTMTAGLFRPANYSDAPADNFPTLDPATYSDEPANLSIFNGTDPNGDWKLYIVDDSPQDAGVIVGGWRLTFTVPSVFTVTNTNDAGAGSLRDAITNAANGDLINFSSLFNTPQTITLTSAELSVDKSLVFQGPGANLLTVRRADTAPDFRIFVLPRGCRTVTISGMTISNGRDLRTTVILVLAAAFIAEAAV